LGICAYCAKQGKLTREHLFPESLARRTPSYDTYIDHSRPSKPPEAAPVLRDVCRKCNNERLGALDAYGAKLTDKYFTKFLDLPIRAEFNCDFHLLLRWLLKLLYNDARATAGAPTEVYRQLIPYILGESALPPLILSLLIGTIAPIRWPDPTKLRYPEHQGFASFDRIPPVDRLASQLFELCRGVFINSYVFVVLSWRSNITRATRRRELAKIVRKSELVEVRSTASVRLTHSCMTARDIMLSTVTGQIQFSGFRIFEFAPD
jgi:uncharacterized short protein YbdD (DUF466 family)